MQKPPQKTSGWIHKFANAFRGLAVGMRGQSSFAVHIPVAIAVAATAWWLRIGRVEWCLLILCISIVIVAELFNSALEQLAQAVTQDHDPQIRDALDIASGAVLIAAIGSAVVGITIFAIHVFGQ